MSRRIDLPDQDRVRQAMSAMIVEATTVGRRPTVVALARKLGLDNATFRRHFPEIVRELREEARPPSQPATALLDSISSKRHTPGSNATMPARPRNSTRLKLSSNGSPWRTSNSGSRRVAWRRSFPSLLHDPGLRRRTGLSGTEH